MKTKLFTCKAEALYTKDWTNKYPVHILMDNESHVEYGLGGLLVQIDNTPGTYYLSTFMETSSDRLCVQGGDSMNDDWTVENLNAVKAEINAWLFGKGAN
jgi:hypothetical protein